LLSNPSTLPGHVASYFHAVGAAFARVEVYGGVAAVSPAVAGGIVSALG
jgi:hypothetical protein